MIQCVRLRYFAVLFVFSNLAPSLARAATDGLDQQCIIVTTGLDVDETERAEAIRSFIASTQLYSENALPPEANAPAPRAQTRYLIGGKMKEWTGRTDQIFSPTRVLNSAGQAVNYYLGSTPALDRDAAFEAYTAAKKSFESGTWSQISPAKRIEHMRKFLDGLKARRDRLINLVQWEINKSVDFATVEVDRTFQYIENTIAEYQKLKAEEAASGKVEGNLYIQIRTNPLGVMPVMAPYNYPWNETATIAVPALIMGNSIVLKPARWGVLLMEPIMEAFQEALPAGAVNLIYGDGEEILSRTLSEGTLQSFGYIGGERAAESIFRSIRNPLELNNVTTGLGAKNMSVILKSTNIEKAVTANVAGAFSYSGQRCTAHEIIFVHRDIAQQFIPAFVKKVEKLKVGHPWEPGVDITASPDTGWVTRTEDYIRDAISKGARIANPSGGLSRNGFHSPTVLVNVNSEMKIYHEEQFSPVVPIVIFDELQEVIDYQKNSPYGQQAAFFGTDAKELQTLMSAFSLLVHRININTACARGPDFVPFGGRKKSGTGVLSLRDALLRFSQREPIVMDISSSGSPSPAELLGIAPPTK